MSILNVDKIQPIGSGSTVTVNATDTILTNVQAGVITATSFTGTINTAAQGNITSLGLLTGLAIDDNTDTSMSSSADGQLKVGGDGYTSAIALDGDAMHIYHNSSIRGLVLGTNETERLRITGAGKVGIGTNNPNQPVSIASGRVSIDVNNDYYGVWADGSTTGENHISVGRWYNTGGGLKSGYSQYGVNNLILENNHPTAAHTVIIQPKGQKVAIGTHVHSDDHLVAVKGAVKATDYAGDYPLSNRRINMNGDFKVCQRATSQASITSNGNYVWDRWYWQNHGPTVTLSQDSGVIPVGQGFRTAAKIETTTASSGHVGNVMAMVYSWEGQDLVRLKYGSANAESLTISFWVRSSQTGVFVTTLKHDSRIVSEQHTISSANTYNKYTWVIPGDTSSALGTTNNNSGMNFYVYVSAGSNTTGGAHQGSWAAHHPAHMAAGQTLDLLSNTGTFYITGIQVEHGEVVTPYEHISYGDELRKCQRYYQFIDGTSDQITFGPGRCNGTTLAEVTIPLAVPLRASPTLTCTQNGCWDSDGGHTSTTAPTVRLWNKNTATLAVVFGGHSGLTNARACVVTSSNNSDFIMSADL